MQFNQTKTYKNLARSFAGESQAGMRYQMIARTATKQGYFELANVIKEIAKNETVHARRFFEELHKRGDNPDNVNLDAGYPFHAGDICDGLRFAALDESEEHTKIYPSFAQDAKDEGFNDIAALYTLIAQVEKRHQQIFEYLYKAFESGNLYKNESPILYVCAECGYMHTATQAWDVCPLCKASQGHVKLHLPYEKEKL